MVQFYTQYIPIYWRWVIHLFRRCILSPADRAIEYIEWNKNEDEPNKTERKRAKDRGKERKKEMAVTPHTTPTIRPPALHHETIQEWLTRHAGHCRRSRDELISDVLLWTPTYGPAKAGRPARTYIQQLCEDTGCSPEDMPEAINEREKWRERVRDIRAGGTTWWYIYICNIKKFSRYYSIINLFQQFPLYQSLASIHSFCLIQLPIFELYTIWGGSFYWANCRSKFIMA